MVVKFPGRIVLASASPARAKILQSAGVKPEIIVSSIDEEKFTASLPQTFNAEDIVLALAQEKANAVIDEHKLLDSLIIACDSMLKLDNQLLGKPITAHNARNRWHHMRGKIGHLLTGHVIVIRDTFGDTQIARGTSSTAIQFASPSDEEIDAYISSGEPLTVAGAFTLDAKGGWFIDAIDGDPSSVIGLSLPLVRTLLYKLGLSPVMIWD